MIKVIKDILLKIIKYFCIFKNKKVKKDNSFSGFALKGYYYYFREDNGDLGIGYTNLLDD